MYRNVSIMWSELEATLRMHVFFLCVGWAAGIFSDLLRQKMRGRRKEHPELDKTSVNCFVVYRAAHAFTVWASRAQSRKELFSVANLK